MDLTAVRGTRDFLVEEKLLRDHVVGTLRRVFERFGFNPIETPAMENWEVLSSKYAGGDEILKETYKLTDLGKRELGLRYDLTVPVCRVMAANPRLAMPFKRYQIQPVWRDGPIKTGRYREFYQCDADTFGVQGQSADAEVIALAQAAFEELGIPAKLKLNNRQVLDGVLTACGIGQDELTTVILSLDKLEKIGAAEVQKEIESKGIAAAKAKKAVETVRELDALPAAKLLEKLGGMLQDGAGAQGVAELRELLECLKLFGVPDEFYEIRVSLARGLSYYNSTVYEATATGSKITSSICGGGRYDNMVGKFSGKEKVPAVGISLGLDVICEVIKEIGSHSKKTAVEVFVAPVKGQKEAYAIAGALRRAGVNAGVDLSGRALSKSLEYCSKQGIPFVAIVGDREAAQGTVTLRELATGKEETVSAQKAAQTVLAARK